MSEQVAASQEEKTLVTGITGTGITGIFSGTGTGTGFFSDSKNVVSHSVVPSGTQRFSNWEIRTFEKQLKLNVILEYVTYTGNQMLTFSRTTGIRSKNIHKQLTLI